MKTILPLIVLALTSAKAFGAYDDGQPSDVIHPMINFVILFGFIGWKVKNMISEAFTKNAEEVESLYNLADEKDKEAQIKLDSLEKKMRELETAKQKILENSMNDLKSFEKEYLKEIEESILRIKRDSKNRIESEKNELLNKLNSSLLERVISKTKQSISGNDSNREKATENLLRDVHN